MNALLKIVAALISTFALFWLGMGAQAYLDRTPAGWPNVAWGPFHLRFPDSLGAQIAASKADLGQCHANVRTVTDAIAEQNAAVTAEKVAGDARLARAKVAAQNAQASPLVALGRVRAIQAAPETGGACEAADRLILEIVK